MTAEGWVTVPASSETRRKIEVVATLLESLVVQVGRSNAPPSEQALTTMERAQLIAILETTLAVLRSPMAEAGLMKKARDALGRAAGKTAEKGLQEGMGAMMGVAKERIMELPGLLF